MIRRLGLLLFFLYCALICAGSDDLWQRLKAAGDAADFPGSPYLIVSDHTQTRVMASGLSYVNREVIYKVLNSNGARELKSMTFSYDPLSAYVEIKEAKIIHEGGIIEDIPLKAVMDYPAPARAIYWGAREKILPVGHLEAGEGVLVRTLQKGFTYALLEQSDEEIYAPPMRGHFYDVVPFYAETPIRKKTYEVFIPDSKKLQFEFYHGDARCYMHNEEGTLHYVWEKNDIMPFKRESDMVDISDVAPKLLLSTAPDWKAKSLWFYKVNEDYGAFTFNQEIKDKVNRIIQGAKNEWEKISLLTHWVAEEIRYSGISMGKGEGYTLHKGDMTFVDRCGVCKDKAGMLVTMLRAAGFDSYPAMTMAGSRIERIPADQFNHCVTLVKLKDGYHLLDPTWVPGVRELWSSAEQQQEYLMGVPEGADLQTTPISPPKNHFISYRISSEIAGDDSLQGRLMIEAEGQTDSMLRRAFTRTPKIQWPKSIQKEVFRMHPEMKVASFSLQDPYDLSKPMKIEITFAIANYMKNGKSFTTLRPITSSLPFPGALPFLRMNLSNAERKYPFRTRSSQQVEVYETIRLAPGMRLVDSPDFDSVTGSGADFTGSIFQKQNAIEIYEKLVLKKRIFLPEDWPSFRSSVLQFRKLMESPLILSRGGSK